MCLFALTGTAYSVWLKCKPDAKTVQTKDILTICKWPKHLIVLSVINSGITINKMVKSVDYLD